MAPAQSPAMGAAVSGDMTEDMMLASSLMPPVLMTRFIRTPTPHTRISVFQGTPLNAVLWSLMPMQIRNDATMNDASPTSILRKMTPASMAAMPSRAMACRASRLCTSVVSVNFSPPLTL